MTLSDEATSIYIISTSFLILSLQLKAPQLTVISILLMLFISTYYAMASKDLKQINAKYFKSTLLVSPNPTTLESEITIKITLGTIREAVPVEVKLEASGLDVPEEGLKWSGIITRHRTVDITFKSTCKEVGLNRVGPLKLIVRDPLGMAAKELQIHQPILLMVLRTIRARSQPITSFMLQSPTIGYTRNLIAGVNYEYKTSVLGALITEAKQIDWKKSAKTGGEPLYIKEYDKLGKSNLNLCLGSGLKSVSESGRRIEEIVIEIFLEAALAHLREGAKIFLTKYEGGRYITSLISKDSGILTIKASERIPLHALTIYVTGLSDPKEKSALKKIASRLGPQLRLIFYSSDGHSKGVGGTLSFLFESVGFHVIARNPAELANSLRRILTRLR